MAGHTASLSAGHVPPPTPSAHWLALMQGQRPVAVRPIALQLSSAESDVLTVDEDRTGMLSSKDC
jgi:hypothetical protein